MTDLRDDMAAAHALLDHYQRRLDEASLHLPDVDAATADGRDHVRAQLRRCLGIREQWVPALRVSTVREARQDSFTVRWLGGTSWPGVYATALLYVPDRPAGGAAPPLVLLCCGHGSGGKLNDNYQQMARALARRGAAVLCPDNLGQGERVAMGHRDAVTPFACGLSVQGLIVMETLGWLRWARQHLPVDLQRIAAIGNSGGGLLTQMLIPFDDDLAVICSSGYPSTFSFIARKEKKHCHCNVLPGVASALEMHHIYGCFAPKPLLLMQGNGDHFFPPDLFHLTARRVRAVYARTGAADQLSESVTPGGHSWDTDRFERIATFLTTHLDLNDPADAGEAADHTALLLQLSDTCFAPWPTNALTINDLACELTGQAPSPELQLWEVFPFSDGSGDQLAQVTSRGDVRQILAQMEAFLCCSADRCLPGETA